MARTTAIGVLSLLVGCGGTSVIDTAPFTSVDAAADAAASDVSSADQGVPEAAVDDAARDVRAEAEAGIPCMAPTDPSKSSLCIQLLPEAIDFVPSDPEFDGKGVMTYEIFTVPVPTAADTPIARLTRGSTGNEMDLSKPISIERFDGLPTTVYARVLFADSYNARGILWGGWWVAGTDYSRGIEDGMPLVPIALTPGQGLTVSMKFWALRQLRVRLALAPDLVLDGDGEGPITVVALDAGYKPFGIAQACGKLAASATIDVVGIVVGTGPYSLVGVLDDFGLGLGTAGDFPPGSVLSFDPASPVPDTLTYTPRSYKVSYALSLGYVLDPPDGGADNRTCAVTDGGATDAAGQ